LKIILSFGGGVNSTAILALALLNKLPMPDYIVFSDTGAEYSYTYKYMDYLENQGIRITYLTGGTKEKTLTDFCLEKKIMPSRLNRWCSDHWKITPIRKFARGVGDVEMWIGIDAGEAHRAEKRIKQGNRFPLIEMGINRNGCMELIKKVGWGIPQKSGCFFCPYQRKRQWVELKKYHPDLWKIAVKMEKQSRERTPLYTFQGGVSLEDYVQDQDKQEELDFGVVLDQKCECYFD